MKLKKIASLALAGIMAVSMLAGCKYGEGSSSSSSSSEATVTSSDSADFASVLNDTRTEYAKDVIKMTYSANSSLEEVLKAALTDKYGKDSNALETLIGKDKFAPAKNSSSGATELASIITDDISNAVVGGVDQWNGASSLPAQIGSYKYARIYVVGGAYTVKEAVNSIRGNLSVVESKDWLPQVTTAKPGMTASYTADVAAVKMTSNAHSDQSAWFVAVVFNQTVTD